MPRRVLECSECKTHLFHSEITADDQKSRDPYVSPIKPNLPDGGAKLTCRDATRPLFICGISSYIENINSGELRTPSAGSVNSR